MKCPSQESWHLLSLGLLADAEAAELHAHVEVCAPCRTRLGAARRNHAGLLRAFEVFDRNHDQLREQLIAAQPLEPTCPRAGWFVHGWRRLGDAVMSNSWRVSGRATAAVLGAAACIALVAVLFLSGGRQGAFAAAIGVFHSARTIVCQVSSPTPLALSGMQIRQTGKLYVSAEHGTRFDLHGNGILATIQYMPLEGPVTVVNPPLQNYTVIDTKAAEETLRAGNSPDEFIRALQNLSAEADRELGRRTIDGADALGYEISGRTLGLGSVPEARSELWVDANTLLPIRYEPEIARVEPVGTLTLVYDRFEWNTPLDAQLFDPQIPAGYTRLDATMPAVNEVALVNGLARFAELSGKYPVKLDLASVVGELNSAIARRAAADPEIDQQALAQHAIEIGAACAFYQKLVTDGRTPEYFGETVEPADSGAVLLRWKLGDDQWRVVYSDLRKRDSHRRLMADMQARRAAAPFRVQSYPRTVDPFFDHGPALGPGTLPGLPRRRVCCGHGARSNV